MLKPFKELYKLDLKKYKKLKPTFKKEGEKTVKLPKENWLDYIEWATVIFLLYDNGAENVTYEFEVNENGYPAFFNPDKKNPFVKIKLTIDNKQYNYQYPVIDGNKVNDIPNQMVIHKAQQRCFVKCVAINTGLGLSLWQKEESNFDDIPTISENNPNNLPELIPGTKTWQEAIKALKNGYSMSQIIKKYYISEENQTKLIDESL